jgi:hypothetical protein
MQPIKTLDAGDGRGWNNCMLVSAIAAVPLEFNVHATNDIRLSTPDPIPHPFGGWVEYDSLNRAGASMRTILANVIETSIDSELYGDLARSLPYFALEGVNDDFLSTSVQECQTFGKTYTDDDLRELTKCIASKVRDTSSRPARMMANVEYAYWKIYLAQKGVKLKAIGHLREFDRMDKFFTDHQRLNPGSRLVVLYNNGVHYRLVVDPRWIVDGPGESLDPQFMEIKNAVISRINDLNTGEDEKNRMIQNVNTMRSLDDIVQFDEMLELMMTGGASKARGYMVPAALALVTLVMSMVPR